MSQKNHRKYLEKTLTKNRKFDSDKILEDYDAFDAVDRKELEDSQYDRLLADTKNYSKSVPAHNFDEDVQYSGKKVSRKDLEEDDLGQDESGDDIDDDEEIDSDGIEVSSNEGDKKKSGKKVNIKNFNIDELLDDINKQDKEVMKSDQNRKEEIKKAKIVKYQQSVVDSLIDSRVKMQDILKGANRFPSSSTLSALSKHENASDINMAIFETEVEILDLIDLIEDFSVKYDHKANDESVLVKRRRLLSAHDYLKSHKLTKKNNLKDHTFDTEQLWEDLDMNFESQLPFIDKVITNWAQKFNILGQSALKGRFSNIFQTPVQQAQKAMDDYERLLKKTQVRDYSSKPIFSADDKKGQDEEVYNDDELYMILFKEMISRQGQEAIDNEENDGFMVETTRLYLKNKLLQSKPKKEVDRKASKNRKLRYDVHQKLANFIAPVENVKILPGRDEILKNLFGLFDKVPVSEVKPKIKKSKKVKTDEKNEDEDDVQLF